MKPQTPIKQIEGIGSYYRAKLELLNIHTLEDLIYHFPFRYDDFSTLSSAIEAKEGERVTLIGEIWSIKNIYTRSRKILTQAVFNDGSGPLELTWFNSPWLTKSIKVGDRLQVSGKVSRYKNKFSITAPQWEKVSGTDTQALVSKSSLHTGRLVPVYPETEGLSSKWLRTKIASALPKIVPQIPDPLPDFIRQEMMPLSDALNQIHFPQNPQTLQKARERLGFDELFYIQLASQKTRLDWSNKPTIEKMEIYQKEKIELIRKLPYELTSAQKRVIDEILTDLTKTHPMNRLVQGEVGSGKTIVAAIVAYIVFLNGYKTLFMAPTEILAFQHFQTVSKLLSPLGINVGIYTGSKKKIEVTTVYEGKNPPKNESPLSNGDNTADIIIGTHALLSEKLMPENVGLIIVDEQQRFGVQQRSFLRQRAKIPHFLTMTATPIPRTVALTIYGDLELSIIDQLPPGRQKIHTHVVPDKKRGDAYGFIAQKIKDEGDQCYIITPLIEQSETLQSAKAATVEYERLRNKVFPNLALGLLHGRLKPAEKQAVLQKFKEGEIDILVSTSVVEVGVDVPNATIMVIESAERFGLAQIHQLRGRVGRGSKQSYCLLFSESGDSGAIQRLKNLEKTDNGLELAELDLKIRGSGQIFGTAQSGRFELKVASFSDLPLIEKTRAAATQLIHNDPQLDTYPLLKQKINFRENIMPD